MGSSRLAGAIALAPLALACSAAAAHAAADVCNPLSFGAVRDGVTDNTAQIQSAINACAKIGGGAVRLQLVDGKGTYLTGPITLASHVRLQIDKGVTLLGSTDHSKYRAAFINYPYHAGEALVSAYQATDTGIIGGGTIDGQGGAAALDGAPSWWKLTQAAGATIGGTTYYAAPYADIPTSNGVPRPWLVEFYQCGNVAVNDITFTNAPMWNLVFRYTSHITVSEYTATVTPDPLVPHTDGIDLVGSSYATLLFLHIGTGGDSIALQSGLPLNVPVANDPKQADLPQLPTHDVQIVNSTVANGNGIVIGDAAVNGVYNVVARNIIETGTGHGLLIRLPRNRAGTVAGIHDIIAESFTLTETRQPLVISAVGAAGDGRAEPSPAAPQTTSAPAPTIHDITVSDLKATGATGESMIVGLADACIRNVRLGNVSIAGSGAALRLRNMTGTLTSVTATVAGGKPPFVVQENVSVSTVGATPPITNSVPAGTPSTVRSPACAGAPG